MELPCSVCGEVHDLSEMQIGHARPDAWYAVPPDAREARWQAGSDLAELDGERFFIRGVLQIPVQGEPEPYAWGVWAVVDEADYREYHARYSEPDAHRQPPFAGRLANQLPGYPQTLGVPVILRPGMGSRRPSFVVDDAAHPLAAEQRDGIALERVLEMLSPLLHRDGPEPRGAPRFATLEAHRWRLLDVEERWASREGPIWFPDAAARAGITVGAGAKLLWEIVASDAAGQPATHVERMWVDVDHREGEGEDVLYSGTLANDPYNPGLTRCGTRAWFRPRHVADVQVGDDAPPASEDAAFRCSGHGASFPTRVCTHLFREQGQGFHTADDPGNPRPDAWCDRCEAERRRGRRWLRRAAPAQELVRACGTCYDIIEEHNRRG